MQKHEFVHVADLGWHGVKNGKLLARAGEEGFAPFVTADRNLEFQQVVSRAGLGSWSFAREQTVSKICARSRVR